ncbi:MAG TPA: sulfurtransferase TusA family protein [Caldisericia bacterium]|jgi:TusA-related sulfurtransferase|nr:MAG: Sulfurtransferase TusA [bacterium ADurb.Bin132]HNW31489.1 sulfurtransferase TusA family protein [Caldisericia bacterium]HNY61540.1 sulfurtransferase TusA family protein [Caldisericia bacterium]HOC79225.1 sulfurtransferase TusA family protein [Caldisericia bacterium]HOG70526.1 sulfurtransferase TusA family protein [Caldisericia bacterium]
MNFDVELNTLGMQCPVPIVKTAKKMKELQIGQVLKVISDDEGIKEDMPAWCKTTGNEFLGLEESGGQYTVYVKKVVG